MGTWMRSKGILAILSGGLAALAMPGIGAWPLAFVCLIPLFYAMDGGRGGRMGYLFGLAFLALDLRWILTLYRFSPLVILGFVLLVAGSALFYAAAGWLITTRTRRLGWGLLLMAPAAFALLDLARATGELGTTFGALYHTLYRVPILIQSAAVFGPWTLTAGLVGVNAALYLGFRDRRWKPAAVAFGMAAAMAAFSLLPIPQDGQDAIPIAIVNSRVQQEVKLDARNLPELADRYVTLGQVAAAGASAEIPPDLIVFPESILPAYILRSEGLLDRFAGIASEYGVSILFGTGDYRNREIYNSVVALNTEGEISGIYDMVCPVPFGEYVPWRGVWDAIGLGGLADSFLPLDLTAGTDYSLLDGIGTPICFESTFPGSARRFVRSGAHLLVTVTNDAWFAGASEQDAHFAATVFRAVETRRWTVQAANGGISGLISPRGRIVAEQEEEGILRGSVTYRMGTSIYTRIGDTVWWVLGSLGCLGTLGFRVVRRSRRRDGGE